MLAWHKQEIVYWIKKNVSSTLLPLDVCLPYAMGYWLPHKPYAVCCSEQCFFKASPRHFQCAPGVCPGAPSFSHLHQWNYWAMIITWLCMLTIFCCRGLLGNHLTVNFCSRMLKHLETGLTITIWHLAMVFFKKETSYSSSFILFTKWYRLEIFDTVQVPGHHYLIRLIINIISSKTWKLVGQLF